MTEFDCTSVLIVRDTSELKVSLSLSQVPIDSGGSGGSPFSGDRSSRESSAHRKEQLLQELKAVEAAIARKRAKLS